MSLRISFYRKKIYIKEFVAHPLNVVGAGCPFDVDSPRLGGISTLRMAPFFIPCERNDERNDNKKESCAMGKLHLQLVCSGGVSNQSHL